MNNHNTPFIDGKGRLARLVEKWFLALNLGLLLGLSTQKNITLDNSPNYYKTISIGFNGYSLKWE